MRSCLALCVVALLGCEGAIFAPGELPGGPFVPGGPTGAPGPGVTPTPAGPPEEDVCEPARVALSPVTVRRLNRFEYDATVRDLLGDTTGPARDFPADDFGHGFDNQGDVLSTAPLLVEKYDAAALKLVQTALAAEFRPAFSQRLQATAMQASVGGASGSVWNLWSNGTLQGDVTVPTAGQYTLRVRAYESAAGGERAQMAFLVGGVRQGASVAVAATSAAPQTYTREVTLAAGTNRVGAEFLNDYYQAPDDRNLYVEWVEVTRPASGSAAGTARLLVCDPATGDACVRTILSTFGRKAWRRPLASAEVQRLAALVDVARAEGDDVLKGLELALHAMLLSPHFLYRVEGDASDVARPLTDDELATRLSYFLWGSMPDDELRRLADEGTLRAQLEAQVTRLLADPRADVLATQFAGSWLWSGAVDEASPDPVLFPGVTPALKAAMRAETEAFFRTFYREDRSALELLTANDTFLTDALAAHYGLPAPGSSTPVRARNLPATRRGLFGHGGLLTVTSQPNRTSPVKRGKWVLSQLLCMEPPPPPPEVEAFVEDAAPTGTLREQMEAHRNKPECMGCHRMMDPIGFGLESYDAVGRFRTSDVGGFPIDTAGELYDGTPFTNAGELAQALSADPRFASCLSTQLFTWALGREPKRGDACAVKTMTDRFVASGHRLPALIAALVTSDTFTTRRGETP